MKKYGNVLALIGAQYGSEGKGVIARHIADKFDIHVRTGGPNAGHSFYHEGVKHVHQTVPCGWTNPNAVLIIGRGGLVEMDILIREVETVMKYDPSIIYRLKIDPMTGIIEPSHVAAEGGTEGEMHQRIGSTGKGVGVARTARMARVDKEFRHFRDIVEQVEKQGTYPWLKNLLMKDTPRFLSDAIRDGQNVLLEGAQGCGLSLIHGPWPYVTSADTNAAQLAADAGIAPQYVRDTLLVARTYPIRVAGNSGPLENEIDWETISARVGRPTTEKTTVTKKTRRIGEWDDRLLDTAVILNGASQVALTFMDYLSPEDEGKTDYDTLSSTAKAFVEYVEIRFGVRVPLVGTGGDGWQVIDRGFNVG